MASLHLKHSFLSSFTQNLLPFKTTSSLKLSFSLNKTPEATPEPEPAPVDPVKLAFEKAKAYRKSVEEAEKAKLEQNPAEGSSGNDNEVPVSVKLAMEKAKEYKNNKGTGGVENGATASETNSGLKGKNVGNLGNASVEKSGSKKDKLSISSIDFKGLNFADKKTGRGLPAGLAPVIDAFPEGDLPEVEIIVGDTSKFDDSKTSTTKPSEDGDLNVYKPKVSTWGVFPRPQDISKTFGGGRTIRPGEVLETAEERAAKEARTKQLLAAYKKKMGFTIDPKLKLECEKAFQDGDSLMDSGKLKEALPYYQTVMDKLPFQSELHGLAALQWSICQDSLSRQNEAQAMYEKLQSHPNARVSKKARQFVFSFQAMEMMKVTGSNFIPTSTEYRNYFDAFVEEKNKYSPGDAESEEGVLSEALLYMFLLVSPIFIVLFIAVQKGRMN